MVGGFAGSLVRSLVCGISAAALAGNSNVTNDGAESNKNLNQKTMKTFGENNAY